MTSKELAKLLGVRVKSVWVALSNLRSEGVISPVAEKPARDVPGPQSAPVTEALVAKLVQQRMEDAHTVIDASVPEGIMQKDERARKLSQIARTAPSNVSVLSIKALEEQERGSGLAVGPSEPLENSERRDRLAKLMLAVGRPVAEEAFALAYPAVQAQVAVAAEPDPELRGEVVELESKDSKESLRI